MMKSHWVLRLTQDGHSKYVTDVYGQPLNMEFESVSEVSQPFQFYSKQEAEIFWKLYQKSHPADATGWITSYEEVEHGV